MEETSWSARHCLSAGDVEFLLNAMTDDDANRDGLFRLLADPDSLDQILDSESLTRALEKGEGAVRLSSRLFFYVLLRRALLEVGLEDRDLADYVAGVCAECVRAGRLTQPFRERQTALLLSIDYAQELDAAQGSRRFHLMSAAGNHYLFMTGFFAAYIEARAQRRGAPGVGYYMGIGQRSFATARDHRLAREYALDAIFDTLVQAFPQVRLSLCEVAERCQRLSA
ncbi:MAG: hypothetical protein ACLFR7_06395 [Opitutales bacterium]